MIDKMVPVRFTFMAWLPLLLVVFVPNVWWGLAVKGLAVLWLIGVLRAAFGPGFSEIQGFGAWATLNALWFGLALISPKWLVYVFSFLIVLGFATIFRMMGRNANGRDA